KVLASSAVMEAPEELATRKLYVGNIPRTVTNDELSAMFAAHGTVVRAEVMYDKYSGRSRRFGFVTMSTAEEVAAAIESLNDTVSFIPSFVWSCLCTQ
uniref:RRM domain-containing protein n=1 Tax=Aegilops tauschii subsp. strangulata TaxID=200361 RepID=A0A453KJC2_AEGTS